VAGHVSGRFFFVPETSERNNTMTHMNARPTHPATPTGFANTPAEGPVILEHARRALLKPFHTSGDAVVDDGRALDAVELFWQGLSHRERIALGRELTAKGYTNPTRLDALLSWAIERLHTTTTSARRRRYRRRGSSSVYVTASAGLPGLGKRR
jgi:hypothetical protein